MNKNQIQHGDVLFTRIENLPGDATLLRCDGTIIVAEGEATGHHHAIAVVEGEATLWELQGERYLEVVEPVVITHDEHKALAIPPGIYQIGRVREHDYFQDMSRLVRD